MAELVLHASLEQAEQGEVDVFAEGTAFLEDKGVIGFVEKIANERQVGGGMIGQVVGEERFIVNDRFEAFFPTRQSAAQFLDGLEFRVGGIFAHDAAEEAGGGTAADGSDTTGGKGKNAFEILDVAGEIADGHGAGKGGGDIGNQTDTGQHPNNGSDPPEMTHWGLVFATASNEGAHTPPGGFGNANNRGFWETLLVMPMLEKPEK